MLNNAFYRLFLILSYILLACLVCSPVLAYGEGALAPEDSMFKKTWKKIVDICDEAVSLGADDNREKKSTLEMITFREPKYVRLLKDAQDVLGVSEASGLFQEIEKFRVANQNLKHEILELKREKVTAPERSYNPLASTKKSIEKSLAKKSDKIKTNESEIDRLKFSLLTTLQENGLNISENELEYFLISAEGSELVRLMAIAENMKKIKALIESELRNEPENIDLAKIYTGMYLVSMDAYTSAHDTAIKNIGNYRSRLKEIVKEAEKNYRDAQRLKRQASDSEDQHIEANMNLSKRTIEVANAYDSLLQRRNGHLEKSRNMLRHRSDVARNTYRTLTNGNALIALVNEGSNEYAMLINFEMPEFEKIYDSGMLTSFAEISERIRKEK